MIEEWMEKGFMVRHDFPEEYVLLVNPTTYEKVRIYEDGTVWVTNKYGEYKQERKNDSLLLP